MTKEVFDAIEQYMQEMMGDSAHDCLHIYRVLSQALEIGAHYPIDTDILIASCLLHDIGRQAQFANPSLCHAMEGGKLAFAFMKSLGWPEEQCLHIQACISTHRFRADNPPQSMEAKILFDADKLDVTGALGIARTLLYKGQVGEPLYTVDDDFQIQNGHAQDDPESFLKEYHFKLKTLYHHFFTPEANAIAQKRKVLMEAFYAELLEEIDIDPLRQLRCIANDSPSNR